MKITGNYNGQKLVVALGFFDSVHKGHRELVAQTVALAKKLDAKPAVFTFSGNPYFVKDDKRGVVLTFDERVALLLEIGVDFVISAQPTPQFFGGSPKEFLDSLCTSFDVAGFTSGTDYSFGKNAEGNVEYLQSYCAEKGIAFSSVSLVKMDGKKIATRDIAALIEQGRVDDAAAELGYGYFLQGTVLAGRGEGKRNSVPTVNLDITPGKVVPKRGVYATETEIDGKVFSSVTNVGAHPTYQDFTENVETFVLDFDGDVYGKTVKVSFKKFLREVQTFSSPCELRAQIGKDAEASRGAQWKI